MSSFEPSFQYVDSFTHVGPRKNRKNKAGPSTSVILHGVMDEFISDSWITHCQEILRESLDAVSFVSPDVLCLGLGSPTGSRNALAQLGFLLKMCEHLNIDRAQVSVYDPIFNEADGNLLDDLKLRRLAEDRHGKYSVDAQTILFMPHCDMHLYENVLQQNWTSKKLSNILFVANRFSEYVESNPLHKMETGFPCLLQLAPFLDSRPLPISNCHPTAFNNTSIQFVRPTSQNEFPRTTARHDLPCD